MFDGSGSGLDDKVFLVSGGSKGIGEEVALQIARLGGRVAVSGRDADALARATDRIAAVATSPGAVAGIRADVSSVPEIEAMLAEACGHFGRIDVLVNCAGTNIRTPALDVTEEEWDTVMNVNLKGAFFTARAFARRLPADRRGRIINISSQYGHVGSSTRVAYCSSKGGLELMSKALAVEWAPRILVNTVCPTFIETDLTRSLLDDPGTKQDLLRRMPMGRFGRVGDVVGAVLYLASDWSDMVTGSSLMVDGGWTAA